MIWAHTLGRLEYYFLGAYLIGYVCYFIRIFIIANKKYKIELGNILQKFFLRSAYTSLMIISLLGPSFGDVKKELKSVGKDIFFVFDVSASMTAYDVLPSRLEKAKKEIKYLISNLRFNDRVGLILFTEEAYLQCPLTYDADVSQLYIESISSALLASTGTNVDKALELAVQKHESAKDDQMNKIIVLISDGENFEGDADQTVRYMKKKNIQLFTLGIGTRQGSKIPEHRGFKKNNKGEYIITRLDDNYLKDLASGAGGAYFEINENINQVDELLDSMNKLEGSIKEVKKIDVSTNKYYYFLACALFLIIIDGLITVNVIRI